VPQAVFHCELAWLGGDVPERAVRVDVDGGRIVAIERGVPVPPGAVRLPGLTLPGLANAHSHAFHRALRGRTHAGTGTFWTWRDEMYRLAAVLDPDSYHRLARATFAEMVLAGITCVGEFHYLHHDRDGRRYADPNAMGAAIAAAAADAGLRMTLLDTCYLGAGIEADGTLRPLEGVQQRFGDRTAEGWAERAEQLGASSGEGVRIGAAVHSVRAVDPSSIEVVAAWADDHGCVLHAHVSEQPAENEQCHLAFNRSPIGVLADQGALGPAFTAVHATHVTGHDVSLLASAGSGVCMCPTTERDLADGVGPTRAFRDSGVPIALGSDSHAVIDVFEEARAVELDERLTSGVRGTHTAVELLRAATLHGHRSLGWGDAGQIEIGALADLVSVDLGSVRTAGVPVDQAMAAVVFAASAHDVSDVVIAGERVVVGGGHRSIDVAAELDSAIRATWEATQ
jgi:formiminoglutamate deiminase